MWQQSVKLLAHTHTRTQQRHLAALQMLLLQQFCCVRKLLNELHRTKREKKSEEEAQREGESKGEESDVCGRWETSNLRFPPPPSFHPRHRQIYTPSNPLRISPCSQPGEFHKRERERASI